MDITPLIPADRQVIDGYGEGQFCIRSEWRAGPVIVFPDRTIPWDVTDFADLTVESFAAVRDAEPKVEILLLGSGPKMQLLPSVLRRDLRAAGIVVDVMDTGAACRTYNVLLAEGRRVAAALLPV
ncbi:Mth938-like domain-containing protein [Azospirillum sp.]|uniref:Mth938-like domain-containing protein n=1 Tax=Azospirillum sp. TaxID=34012 RepID=UPI002D2E9329|nr:Mth938-like domain-containing protein [Azospirillum sp.]HYD67638.1 Mth938-like domain-containing protein [Azospirillum sp.]